MIGRITFFHTVRRFGYILTDGKQTFFHASNCSFEPALGQNVTYDLAPAFRMNMPPQAVNVNLTTSNALAGTSEAASLARHIPGIKEAL